MLAVAAAAAQAPVTPVRAPDFSRDVMPIFESNCLRCHNSAEEKGGLLLESYEDLMRGGDDGVPVVAGNADDSPIIRQLEGHAKPKMPPKADLRPEDIATLRAWIAAGAKVLAGAPCVARRQGAGAGTVWRAAGGSAGARLQS